MENKENKKGDLEATASRHFAQTVKDEALQEVENMIEVEIKRIGDLMKGLALTVNFGSTLRPHIVEDYIDLYKRREGYMQLKNEARNENIELLEEYANTFESMREEGGFEEDEENVALAIDSYLTVFRLVKDL